MKQDFPVQLESRLMVNKAISLHNLSSAKRKVFLYITDRANNVDGDESIDIR